MIKDDEKLFATTPEMFRRAWWRTLERHCLEFMGPPHIIRHTGPSHDVGGMIRTLEQARRRGRWSQIKSVERYTKSQDLVVHDSLLPQVLREKAEEEAAGMPQTFFAAVEKGKNAHWIGVLTAAGFLPLQRRQR